LFGLLPHNAQPKSLPRLHVGNAAARTRTVSAFNLKTTNTLPYGIGASLGDGISMSFTLTFAFRDLPNGFQAGQIEIHSQKLQDTDYKEGQERIRRNSTPQKF
jgi:hypothetical protein